MRRPLALVAIAGGALAMAGSCGFEAPRDVNGNTVTVGFLSTASLQDEASGQINLVVALTGGPSDELVSVHYKFSGGTATSGTDYVGSDNVLTIPPGATDGKIPLTILMDGVEEDAETIEIKLSDADGAVLGTSQHTVTISSDILPRVKFEAAGSTADEATSAVLALSLDAPSDLQVSVDYVLNGTAVGGGTDYTLAAGTVLFPPGVTHQQLMLAIQDDMLDEFDENVLVTLTSSDNVVVGTTASHDHVITDNDAEPTVAFNTSAQSKAEDGTKVDLVVELSVPSGKPIQVDVSNVLGQGSATPLLDYLFPTTRTLDFAPGETQKTVSVLLVDDQTDEDDETFNAALSVKPGYNVGLAMMGTTDAITITDDDDPPFVAFQTNSGSIGEGDDGHRDVDFRVVLSRASAKPITVPIVFSGDATDPGDYSVIGNPISIPPGQTTGDITIRVVSDHANEGGSGDDVIMTISTQGLVNVTRSNNDTTRTLQIVDDD